MKIVTGKIGLILRLGMTAIVLLLGQQAMAVGTDAGTSIDNTVDVDYEVAGFAQTTLSDSVSFVVDRRVDFTLTQLGGALVDVTPGEDDAFFDLLLTNTSNSALDFRLVLDATIVLVRGEVPDASMSNIEYAVSADIFSATNPDPIRGVDPQFVDELPEDEAIRIRVWGDAALTMSDGEIDGIEIEATAAEPGGAGLGADLTEDVDTALGVENVFADDAPGVSDGVEAESDGFLVVTAQLAVTKSYAVFDDPLSSGLTIPGATIEYTITVVNSSDAAAEDVVITDTIDSDVTIDLNVADYSGNDIDINNGGATLPCDIEINGDGDGCDSVLPDFTVGAGDLAGGITVAGNTTLTIRYRITIPTP